MGASGETDGGEQGWRPDLLETMRFDPFDGMVDLERHLARLKASGQALGLAVDRHAVRNELHAATFRLTAPARVRVRVSPAGATAVEAAPLPTPPPEPVAVALAPLPVPPDDPRLRHKTGDRGFRDAARAAAGTWEVLFIHPDGQLTEGTFTSLFVPGADGRLRTPPDTAGLMPGVLRARLLDSGEAIEARLVPADLAAGFFVGNALRGLVAARLA